MKRYEGKVVIVTGGAGALGSATVKRLVEEGAQVVVADLNKSGADDLCNEIGERCIACEFDATNPESIQQLVTTAVATFGRLDFLVNNVARTRQFSGGQDTTVVDTPIEVWDSAFTVNVRSYFLACKFALPHLIESRGAIVNIASGSALGGDAALVAYGTSKAAVVSLTQYVAAQYGRSGVRCNTVCPGVIATPNLESHAADSLRGALNAVYVPELGKPRHIAAAIAYLGSEEAAYTNGASLTCDGGLTAVITPWMADTWNNNWKK